MGKTYLVDQVFEGRITFRHTGLSPIEGKEAGDGLLKAQLRSFYESMVRQGFAIDHCPVDWQEAFFMLSMALQDIDDGSRQLVFLDELPWMDTPRSFFMTALEGFWNGWACHRPGFMLIVCGSANSWILDKLVKADVLVLATPVYFYSMDGQLKTLIDRTLPRYTEIRDKEVYFIATAAAGRGAMERTVDALRGFTDCLPGAEVKGVVYGSGVYQKGEVMDTKAFQEAYQLGKKV